MENDWATQSSNQIRPSCTLIDMCLEGSSENSDDNIGYLGSCLVLCEQKRARAKMRVTAKESESSGSI